MGKEGIICVPSNVSLFARAFGQQICHVLYACVTTVLDSNGPIIECFHVKPQVSNIFRENQFSLCWCPFAAQVSCDLRSFTLEKMSKEKDNAPQLSEYANTVDPLVKKRYMQKRACIGVDPFLTSYQNNDAEFLPSTESIDLVSYLVLETSYCSKAQFKTFKILQAYNRLVSGFVQSVKLNHCRLILLSAPTATLYNWENYNDFVVCSIKVNFEFVCQKVTPNQHHWDTVLPKLTNFWRICLLPEILGRWYTQKRDITLKQCDAGAVCFCTDETGEAVVHCSNTACLFSTYDLSCLKLMGVPKNWMCPHKGFTTSKTEKAINVR